MTVETQALAALGEQLLERARSAGAGRAAESVYSGSDNVLRQTMLALTAGTELAEHESPGEATLQVLTGSAELHAGDDVATVEAGQLVAIPPTRHRLLAVGDAVVLLTVAKTA